MPDYHRFRLEKELAIQGDAIRERRHVTLKRSYPLIPAGKYEWVVNTHPEDAHQFGELAIDDAAFDHNSSLPGLVSVYRLVQASAPISG